LSFKVNTSIDISKYFFPKSHSPYNFSLSGSDFIQNLLTVRIFSYIITKEFVDMNKPPIKPTEGELEILRILWKEGPSTVRVVNDKLNEEKPVGYTTTLKLMQIMLEKGILKRNDESKTHTYTATLKQEETQKQLLEKILNTAFGGSAVKLAMQALGGASPSKQELSEIRKLLDNLEGGAK
jgi:BlaI family transcriptional regulator, penicillinase repressor